MPAQHRPDPDAAYREWMTEILAAAAGRFALILTGPPVFGWRDRSISAPAHSRHGARWLRVVSEADRWARGDFWTGNSDANAIRGITKPSVLDLAEWDEGPRHLRAEIMTLLPGQPCSPTDVLHDDVYLPDTWWAELRHSLTLLAATPTTRVNIDTEHATHRIRTQLGENIDLSAMRWGTIHGDLHWSNLMKPRFGLLDWEGWGHGPTGTDPATLYCYSLLTPATAEHVHDVFADELDNPAGVCAQLYVTARLLHRAAKGDHPELIEPLHDLAGRLTGIR